MRDVENNNIAFLKIQIKTGCVYWVYNAKCTRHLVAISRNGQKSGCPALTQY